MPSVVAHVRALVAGWSPDELRWLLGLERDGRADPLELAALVDGAAARAGRLAALIAAWGYAERADPGRINVDVIAAVIAAGADGYRASRSVEVLGEPAAPAPELVDVDAFGRLLALAAAAGVSVEWRTLSRSYDGMASLTAAGPVVVIRPGAGVEVLAHELGHVFDPVPWQARAVGDREAFADMLGARLVSGRVLDPVTARRLALDVTDELDRATDPDAPAPVVLDVIDRALAVAWFVQELAG